MNRAFILDPSITSKYGHHFIYTTELRRALTAQGKQVFVFVAKTSDADIVSELAAERLFSFSIYVRSNPVDEYQVPRDWVDLNRSFERELSFLNRFDLGRDDLIILHTTWGNQILGLFRWYRRLAEPRPKLCFKIHYPASLKIAPENAEIATALLTRALQPWSVFPKGRVLIGAATPQLAQDLSRLSGVGVVPLPLIVRTSDLQADRHANPVPRFVCPGQPRDEKGVQKLLDAIQESPSLSGTRFLLQTREQDVGAIRDYLGRRADRMEFVHSPLTRSEYAATLARSDAVLLPYDPEAYRVRASSVFVEALASGRPVLVMADTWMDQEFIRLGMPGVRVESWTPQAIADGITRLSEELDARRSIAQHVASAYGRNFTAERFLETIGATLAAA